MNECYAVDPRATSDTRQLKSLLREFGMEMGRFIAIYPPTWQSALADHLTRVSALDRHTLFELVSGKRNAFLPVLLQYDSGADWAINAAAAAKRRPIFNGVIGQPDNGYGWPSIDQVLYDDAHSLPDGRGDHIEMCAAKYGQCARPLFDLSEEVTLVDPYFTLRDRNGQISTRHRSVLLELLRAAEASVRCRRIRLMLSRRLILVERNSVELLKLDLNESRVSADCDHIEVKHELRDDVGHGRYLLSVHGGLQFDRGFEEKRSARNHVHWLSSTELKPLQREFLPTTSLALEKRR